MVGNLLIPKNIWIEMHDTVERDAGDVIVEMEDDMVYTAVFVTLSYLRRQMDLTCEFTRQLPDTAPVRCAVLETPHIVVENLERDTIEDTIDNLIALDIFEGSFTQVTDAPASGDETTRTTSNGKRATAEVAAVVISDVLVVEG